MKISNKTFVAIAVSLGIFIVIQAFLSRVILMDGFDKLEQRDAQTSLDRVRDALGEQVDALSVKVVDWAVWDDAYGYVQNRNREFEKSNLTDNALPLLKVHLLIYLDAKQEVVAGLMADAGGAISGITPGVLAHLKQHPALFDFKDGATQISGMARIDGRVMLVSTHPVVKSDGSGPIRGAILIGRYLDREAVDKLSHLTHLPLEMAVAGEKMPERFAEAAASLRDVGDRYVQMTSDDTLTGYMLYKDIYGENCLYLAALVPRDVHKRAHDTMTSFLIATIIGAFFLMLVTNWAINRSVVAPIVALNKKVGEIGKSDDLGIRVPVSGDDEIAGLAREMNKMLDHIEERATELSRTLGRYEAAREEAERANKAKSFFLANMSHELRTPINAIVGLAEMLSFSPLDPEQKEMFKGIRSEALALSDLIGDILDLSKIESGNIVLANIPFNLNYLFRDLAESFAHQAERAGITFQSAVVVGIPSTVSGDPGRLRQILKNLLVNALKFTPAGGTVGLNAEAVEELPDGRYKVKFTVKDSGIGVPAGKQKTIFERFQQVDESIARGHGGTGLGLTISKQLTELMGGVIGVESVEGRGATFWFTVILAESQAAAESPASIFPDVRGVKILVVNNAREVRDGLARQIESLGYVVKTADGAPEALALLKSGRFAGLPDLIFCQLHMRDGGGFEFAERLKADGQLADIPLIITTTDGDCGDANRCRQLGVRGYWTEPLTADDVQKMVMAASSRPADGGKDGRMSPFITRHFFRERMIRGTNILLAEDYPVNQKVARSYLKLTGFNVDVAGDGKEAVGKFKGKKYDLVLMDVQMPEMDGLEATRVIRAMERAGGTDRAPIIALTAHATESFRDDCLAAGMDDFLSKPFNRGQLLMKVAKWLRLDYAPDGGPDECAEGAVKAPAPLDFAKAVEEFHGDEELVVEIIDDFLSRLVKQIAMMEAAAANGDGETVRREAHSIKGGAGNIHAYGVAETARKAEASAEAGDLAGASAALKELEKEAGVLREYFKTTIAPR